MVKNVHEKMRQNMTNDYRLQIKFLETRQLSLQNGKPENRRTYATTEFNLHEG